MDNISESLRDIPTYVKESITITFTNGTKFNAINTFTSQRVVIGLMRNILELHFLDMSDDEFLELRAISREGCSSIIEEWDEGNTHYTATHKNYFIPVPEGISESYNTITNTYTAVLRFAQLIPAEVLLVDSGVLSGSIEDIIQQIIELSNSSYSSSIPDIESSDRVTDNRELPDIQEK